MTESLAVLIVVCATRAMPIYARLILYLHGYNSGKACHVHRDFAAVADCACHSGEVLEVSFRRHAGQDLPLSLHLTSSEWTSVCPPLERSSLRF